MLECVPSGGAACSVLRITLASTPPVTVRGRQAAARGRRSTSCHAHGQESLVALGRPVYGRTNVGSHPDSQRALHR